MPWISNGDACWYMSGMYMLLRIGFLQLSFFVTNLQGDVIAVCDNTNVPRFFYHYDAWGKLLSVTNTNG